MSILQLSYDQLLGLLVIVLTLLVILLSAVSVSIALTGRRRMRHQSEAEADGSLPAVSANVRTLDKRLANHQAHTHALEQRLAALEQAQTRAIGAVGLCRFNAFADTGSDLSFSLALLDSHRDGVVVTSLYGRDEGRVYAKRIEGGTCSILLSDEEKSAVALASRNRPR